MQNTPQIFGYLSDIELYEFAVAITAKDTFQWHQKDIDIELSRYKIILCTDSFFGKFVESLFVSSCIFLFQER